MRKLLALILLSATASAITFTGTNQNALTGETIDINITLSNTAAIWGFSFKLTENPASPITLINSTPGTRLAGGYSGATQNNNSATVYSVFPGTTTGITAGTDTIYTLKYNVPASTTPGTYNLIPSELMASDQNGQQLQANITPITITVAEPPEFSLPTLQLTLNEEKDATICVTNQNTARPVQSVTMTITHNQNILTVTNTSITQGNGTTTLQTGSTTFSISGLNISSSDCATNPANIAAIRYKGAQVGSTPLEFQSINAQDASTQPFSAQSLSGNNGHASVSGTSSASSGAGGSGGGGSANLNNCATCGTYTCCGQNPDQAKIFCERPEAYPGYCTGSKPEAAQPSESLFDKIAQAQATKETPAETTPEPEPVQEAAEETVQEEIPQQIPTPQKPSKTPWIIGTILFAAVIGILIYRHKKQKIIAQ